MLGWRGDSDDALPWAMETPSEETGVPLPLDEQPEGTGPVSASAYDDTLDWLSSLEQEEEPPVQESLEGVEAEADLSLEMEAQPGPFPVFDETVMQTGEPPSSDVEELPDWFAESLSEAEADLSERQEAVVLPFGEDVPGEILEQDEQPEWFTDLQEEPETPAQPAQEEADMPDWLQQAGEGESPFAETLARFQVESPVQPSEETGIEPGAAEWLSDLGAPVEAEGASIEAAAPDEEIGETSFAAFNMEEGETVPDWLARLDASEPPAGEGGVPAFILDVESSPSEMGEGVDLEALPELGPQPDWLEEISAGQELPPLKLPQNRAKQPTLAPAELPGWLEAMRPSESMPSAGPYRDTSDERTESSGLLSGLPGVLPGNIDWSGCANLRCIRSNCIFPRTNKNGSIY
jgi:hypothetical protein